jgi:hypothetical protein
MEPEDSLPHSQQPATSPYPEPDRSSPCPPSHFLKIHFNIILQSPSLRFPHQNPVRFSPLPCTCYMPCLSHSSRFDDPNNIWGGVQSIKRLVMQQESARGQLNADGMWRYICVMHTWRQWMQSDNVTCFQCAMNVHAFVQDPVLTA